jgi:hypothetical protein
MVENISTTFRCNICNKNYKDKTGLWYHNKKYHTIINNHNDNTNNTFDNTLYDDKEIKVKNNTFDNTFDNTLNDSQIIDKNYDSKYKCKKCNKNFKNYQNRWKHEKICKATEENVDSLIEKNILLENTIKQQINEIVQIKQTIDEQKKMFEQQIIEMKNQLLETMNKNCKVHLVRRTTRL